LIRVSCSSYPLLRVAIVCPPNVLRVFIPNLAREANWPTTGAFSASPKAIFAHRKPSDCVASGSKELRILLPIDDITPGPIDLNFPTRFFPKLPSLPNNPLPTAVSIGILGILGFKLFR